MTSAPRRSLSFVLLVAASLGPGAPLARAETLPGVTLPTLALDPVPQPSCWTGLYVGTEIFAISRKGSKGLIGGGVDAGYNREFANNIVLGIQGSTGFAPGWSSHSRLKGFDYAATDLKIGYDMGRLLPYVTAGLALERDHLGPGAGSLGSDSFNSLLGGAGQLHAATRVGVGVDYAITNNLTLGVAVSAVSGRGPLTP
jgi:opacity protein-like surface antigen